MDMSDVELIEFNGNTVTVTVVLEDEDMANLKRDWGRVKGCQTPLIGTYKNGFSVFIPWMLKEKEQVEG